MSENRFTQKMAKKSSYELEEIILKPEGYVDEAVNAAKKELYARKQDGRFAQEENEKKERYAPQGEELYADFFEEVNAKSKLSRKPKAKIDFKVVEEFEYIFILALKVFEKLHWDVVYLSESQIEAKRKWDKESKEWSSKITVKVLPNKTVEVESVSLTGVMWDKGLNSALVQLFEHVYKEEASKYSKEDLNRERKELEGVINWDDYKVPEELPKIPKYKQPAIIEPVLAGIFGGAIISAIFVFFMKITYLLFLYETVAAFLLGFCIAEGAKFGNFTHFRRLKIVIFSCSLFMVMMIQFIDYLVVASKIEESFTFFQFIKVKFDVGLNLNDTNLGGYGWLGVLLVQMLLFYFLTLSRVSNSLLTYIRDRVPLEVIEFASYHFIKEKSQEQVRNELAKKGWNDKTAQDYVFEAIGVVQEVNEIVRSE